MVLVAIFVGSAPSEGRGGPGLAAAQPPEAALPVVDITGPTVIAFWKSPTSNQELTDDPDLAAALDEQQYYWAESRDRLAALGITPIDQPGREFRIRDGQEDRVFSAPPDSAVVGYLLVEPGRAPRAIYRVQYPDQLMSQVGSFFGIDTGG